jgi:alanine racemase
MAFHRASQAEVNLSALRDNFTLVRKLLPPATEILAVVKADAYGHGVLPCAKTLLDAGANGLGVAIGNEGIELRENGIKRPILVMGGFVPEEIGDMVHHNLEITLHEKNQAIAIAQEALRQNKCVKVHLKIDTGMGRLGTLPSLVTDLANYIDGEKSLQLVGVSTHLATAEWEDKQHSIDQIEKFRALTTPLKKKGTLFPKLHCANSAGIINHPDSWFDCVRPGIMLYGSFPSTRLDAVLAQSGAENPKLKPVMTWKCRLLQIKDVPKGTPLSYGAIFTTQRDSRIGLIGVGYADGLHRQLSNKMELLIRGKRVPQVGRICMDSTLIDVTDHPEIKVGDEAVIFGHQNKACIRVEETAEKCGTISYELLCAVGQRVPRIYIDPSRPQRGSK